MDIEILKEIREYLESLSLSSLMLNKGYLVLDFRDMSEFSSDLAVSLLDDFEETIKAFEDIIADFKKLEAPLRIRIKNIPITEQRSIWKLRAKDVGKIAIVKGYIRKISDVLHSIGSVKVECPLCGNIMKVMQFGDKLTLPNKCSCGRKGYFKIIEKDIYDLQKMVLEEDPKELKATQKPRRLLIYLKNDLCREEIDKSLQPSVKVQVTGIIKDKPIKRDSVEYSKYLEANYIEVIDENYESIKFSKEEIEEFKKVANTKTLYDDMAQSIIPTIYGHEIVKKAIFLQLMGGSHLYNDNILEERGNIHILLCASPGTGKSQILKRVIQFCPNSRFMGGRGATGTGLVAAVAKDEELGWTLEAGSVTMCNKGGIAAIDELDKIDKSDIAMLNNVMVDNCIKIDKATIHAELETDVSILGAANPINRVFDKREAIWKQIGLPKDFLDRFDLIFPIETMESEEDQRKVAGIIFSKYKKSKETKPIYPKEFVVKYISYARQNFNPSIPSDVEEFITDNFINLVKPKSDEDQAYFSSRLLTNIIRLTSASAKARLSNSANEEDARLAMDILIESLRKQDIISQYGLLDVEKLEAVIPKSKRDKMHVLKQIISNLCKDEGTADIMRIIELAGRQEITEEEIDDLLEKLKNAGDIFSPKSGKYKVI